MGQNQFRTTCPVKLLGFWVFPVGFRQKWGQYIQVYDEFQWASLTTPTLKDTHSVGFELAGVCNGMFKISIMMWINTPLFLLNLEAEKCFHMGKRWSKGKDIADNLQVLLNSQIWMQFQICNKSQYIIMSLCSFKNTYRTPTVWEFSVCVCVKEG